MFCERAETGSGIIVGIVSTLLFESPIVSNELLRPADNFIELVDFKEHIQKERNDGDAWLLESLFSTLCHRPEAIKIRPANQSRNARRIPFGLVCNMTICSRIETDCKLFMQPSREVAGR